MNDISCIILAAGMGTRMKSSTHKMMHKVGGMPLVWHVMNACKNELGASHIATVLDPDQQPTRDFVDNFGVDHQCFQKEKLGTGHAVMMAEQSIKKIAEEKPDSAVIVLYADTPFVEKATLLSMAAKIEAGDDVVVLGFQPDDPAQYGRLLIDNANKLLAIREFKDASDEERAVDLCNSGIMAFRAKHLWQMLEQIDDNNASKEYYLTDCVEIANQMGLSCSVSLCSVEETLGVNDRVQLAMAEKTYQEKLRKQAMLDGVTMIDPGSVFLGPFVKIENDVVLEPNIVLQGHVTIKTGSNILAFSHISGTEKNPVVIGENAQIGPYARIREGSEISEKGKIGNFVETKKSKVGVGSKVNHLTYIGDAEIGEGANIGAGTITCNYDGFNKFKTIIGDGAFVGSNSSLVAPVEIEAGGYVGSGSVVTKNVSSDGLAVTRAKQVEIKNWAKKFREKQNKS